MLGALNEGLIKFRNVAVDLVALKKEIIFFPLSHRFSSLFSFLSSADALTFI